MSTLVESSNWSHLPADILSVIAHRLNNNNNQNSSPGDNCTISIPVIHNLCLRSVCKSWRLSIPLCPSPHTTAVVVPFPVAPNPSLNPNRLGHFTLSHSTIYLLQHQPPHSSSSSSSLAAESPYWLLRVENYNNNNKKWHPIHPLSRIPTSRGNRLPKGFPKSIDLLKFRVSHIHTSHALRFVDTSAGPDLPIKVNELKSFYVKKVAVSTSSSGSLAIMAISGAKLWFYGGPKDDDNKWREINGSKYEDVVFHNGKFYAVDIAWGIVCIDVSDLKVVKIVPSLDIFGHGGINNVKNLVVCDGALYVIGKCFDYDFGAYWAEADPGEGLYLKIYKLNEERKIWERVNDLDNCVPFVGDDCSYSISARNFPAFKTNCVYFLNYSFIDANKDKEKLGEFCDEIGVYCLDDGSCGPLADFPDHWSLFLAPPTFVKPKASKSKKK